MTGKKKSKRTTLGSRLTSIVSVSLVLVLLGVVAMTAICGHNGSKLLSSNIGFVVKIDREADSLTVVNLTQRLAGAPFTRESKYSSPEAILAEESKYIGEEAIALVDENPYNAEIEVKVKEYYASPDSVASLAARVQAYDGVEEVLAQTAVLRTVNTNLHNLMLILLIVAAALLAISLVLINNTVYLSVYSRRFTINTMRLVGATPGFIRAPFVKAGAVTGLIASLVAIALLVPFKLYLCGIDPMIADLLPLSEEIMVYVALLLLGTAICAGASAVATTRYIRVDYDDMFK